MKRFLLFLVTTSFLLGEIIPVTSLKDIEEEVGNVDQKTWIIFDVDFTLILPKEPILWGIAEPCLEAIALKINPQFKERDRMYDWSLVLRDMEWELVNNDSPRLIRAFQEKGATVIALTAMPHGAIGVLPSMADWREGQLHAFGFDFGLSSPKTKFLKYQNGVIYSDRAPKGQTLVDFLKHLEVRPERIIFVDDRLDFIESMEQSMKEEGIPLTCYYYTEAEIRPVVFIPHLVREKLNHFFTNETWPTHFSTTPNE